MVNERMKIKALNALEDVSEHIDDRLKNRITAIENYVKASYEEIRMLKRENKALDEEGVAKCELNEKLNKALDKTCKWLDKHQGTCPYDYRLCTNDWCEKNCREDRYTGHCWKAWCLENE